MRIEKIPAGREMDAIIAEHIFGWKTDGLEGSEAFRDANMSHYSTDIADAWTVLEHLNDLPLSLLCVLCRPHAKNRPSVMLLWGGARSYPPEDVFLHLAEEEEWSLHPWMGDAHPVTRVSAETMPLAICRAALKATGYPG